MSRFNGWVPYRRGIIEHVIDGRLTGFEHYALSQLLLLADAATGGDRINAPLLCYYCGHVFNQDTGQRLLNSLHAKRYIWYRGQRFSTIPQPYWIDSYRLTKGPMKTRMTRLSELYDKATIYQDDVWKLADDSADDGTDESTDDGADNYKKRDKRMDTKENLYTYPADAADYAEANAEAHAEAKTAAKPAAHADRRAEAHAEARISCAATDKRIDTAMPTVPFEWGDELAGCRFLKGEDPHYLVIATGRQIRSYDEAKRLAESGGALQ